MQLHILDRKSSPFTCDPIKIPKNLFIQHNPKRSYVTIFALRNLQGFEIDHFYLDKKNFAKVIFSFGSFSARVLLLGNFGRWAELCCEMMLYMLDLSFLQCKQPVSFLSMVVGKGSLAHCFYSFLPHCVRASVCRQRC